MTALPSKGLLLKERIYSEENKCLLKLISIDKGDI